MKANCRFMALVVFSLACSASFGQFVKGNEAVRTMADGSKRVETPPLPSTGPIRSIQPCRADGGCHGGPWLIVETSDGLRECTEAYARPGSCRASTYGTEKRLRLWVVKAGSVWLKCQFPDLGSKCVSMFARPPANLPYPAVQ